MIRFGCRAQRGCGIYDNHQVPGRRNHHFGDDRRSGADLPASLTKLIPLRLGPNVITVKAEVPGNASTYTLNVERMDPVLRPSELAVVEYKDNKGRFDFANVELSPMYNQASSTVMRYEANVRSHIASVGIAAQP